MPKKKMFLQLFLFLIIVAVTLVFFNTYFTSDDLNNISKKNITEDNNQNQDNTKSNIMYNIKYASNDKRGNSYIINSEIGELNFDQPGLILMKSVVATINMKNSEPIMITSNNALYNSNTYDTNFYDNVLMTYNQHKIYSNNLDLMFKKNLATISNDIVYKNLNTKLQADKVEIDLTTKNSKIFMNDKSSKVKIMSIN